MKHLYKHALLAFACTATVLALLFFFAYRAKSDAVLAMGYAATVQRHITSDLHITTVNVGTSCEALTLTFIPPFESNIHISLWGSVSSEQELQVLKQLVAREGLPFPVKWLINIADNDNPEAPTSVRTVPD